MGNFETFSANENGGPNQKVNLMFNSFRKKFHTQDEEIWRNGVSLPDFSKAGLDSVDNYLSDNIVLSIAKPNGSAIFKDHSIGTFRNEAWVGSVNHLIHRARVKNIYAKDKLDSGPIFLKEEEVESLRAESLAGLEEKDNFPNFKEMIPQRMDSGGPYRLLHCSGLGDKEGVMQELQKGVEPNLVDYDKRTALHLASSEGCLEIVVLLLEKGADVNSTDRWGRTDSHSQRGQNHALDLILLSSPVKS
ncbi:hypothetical protein BC332_25344 [Capsicum chinense]|nr:hypothetical protein BC332_25344 [Capsicum chinense]